MRDKKPRRNQRNQRKDPGISRESVLENWKPKTEIGMKVKKGEITDINDILDQGIAILESEIVDALLPDLEVELLEVGQSKGKFGGGKRSIWRQTQKKSKEGNKPSFTTIAVCGNKNGYIGIGLGKAKETVPAREKATRKAKLNLIKIKRGCGSWECGCGEAHSIPFEVEGKCSSVIIKLKSAPKGTRLCVETECQKILKLAGFKDVYSKARGQTKTKLNLIFACFDALKKLGEQKVKVGFVEKAGVVGGRNE
ncbi:MAG: 30S ribosomal protein S5 [Nanoarchaeota archaeon]|nr:30S ribosomal protein S5 [Nanoarchaeota archaeon]